ncbi:uncharacterized protein LOC117334389 [Pecten maximus]|uniref:uncharacterized protein LOC117334389 n=1 Tax=Pecten maximus TaxID=6579 RepID=UPI0014581C6E|nr:uncharacterized protein LOC117334389 [Pecten maximus]
MSNREEEDEEKHGATAAQPPHSTTDGLLSSCFPPILGKKKCSSAIDDDGEVYSKANTKSETTEGQTLDAEKPEDVSKQHKGGSQANVIAEGSQKHQGGSQATASAEGSQKHQGVSQANVTTEGSQKHQGGSQATVTAQLAHQQGGAQNVIDDDDEEECFYPINQNCPGVAILIGHSKFDTGEKERKGAHMDLKNTFEVFERLGFLINFFMDEEVMVLQHKLKELAMSERVKKADCLVCVVSTHGSEQEVGKGDRDPRLPSNVKVFEHFLSMKNGVIKTRELIEIFDDSHCKALRGKPKLFFIQACRSRTDKSLLQSMDPGIQVDIVGPVLRPLPTNTTDFMSGARSALDNQGSQPLSDQRSQSQVDARAYMAPVLERDGEMYYEHTPPFPLFEDIVEVVPPVCPNNFLIMFATPSEMVAWSEDDSGGWLLSALYLEFIKHIRNGTRIALLPTLTDVSRHVAYKYASRMEGTDYHKMKSVPCLEHKLTRDVYLTPSKKTSY